MAKAATEEKKVIVTERLMSPVKYLMLIIHLVNPNIHDDTQAGSKIVILMSTIIAIILSITIMIITTTSKHSNNPNNKIPTMAIIIYDQNNLQAWQ